MVGDLDLANRLLEDRCARLREEVLSLPETANVAFRTLVLSILDRLDAVRTGLPAVYDAEEPDELPLLLDRLDIVRRQTDSVHAILGTYGADLDRRLPVGLRHLVLTTVAAVVERPLGFSAIPLVHLDARNRYATYDLVSSSWTLLTSDVDVTGSVVGPPSPDDGTAATSVTEQRWRLLEPVLGHKVVIINVPALDPANAFLAPILAHEVAHVAVDHRLLGVLTADLDSEATDALYNELTPPPGGNTTAKEQSHAAMTYLEAWLREELCDAVACALTGPAFLFAAAAHIPITATTGFNRHPFPQDRIRWALRFLDKLGWHDFLLATVPGCHAYLSGPRQAESPPPEPFEPFVRETVDIHVDDILRVVIASLGDSVLTPERFRADDKRFGLVESLRLGYVPGLEGGTPGLWSVLLAGWVAWLEDDDPARIPAAVVNVDVNAFLIKTLELVEVTDLWLTPA